MAAEKPLILFVHAAFHRPIHYNAVLNSLRDKNFTVIAPELPSTGTDPTLTYADDVDVLNSALEPLLDRGKEVVVVAHDFGALAASHCIEGESVSERAECGLGGGIRHYINVCGLSYPEMGRNIVGKREDFPLPDYYHVEDGLVHLLDTAKPMLYSDLTSDQIQEIWPSVVKTHSLRSLNGFPSFVDKDIRLPKTYVFCEEDLTLATEYQAFFVGTGGYEDVIRLPCGHFPFLKMPGKMIEIISGICERQ